MAFRLTKNVLANASRARVAASAPRATGGVFTVASAAARRGMASAASGSAHNTASSDKPWIVSLISIRFSAGLGWAGGTRRRDLKVLEQRSTSHNSRPHVAGCETINGDEGNGVVVLELH